MLKIAFEQITAALQQMQKLVQSCCSLSLCSLSDRNLFGNNIHDFRRECAALLIQTTYRKYKAVLVVRQRRSEQLPQRTEEKFDICSSSDEVEFFEFNFSIDMNAGLESYSKEQTSKIPKPPAKCFKGCQSRRTFVSTQPTLISVGV